MRKIKFRGKTLDGRWIYGDLWHRPYAKDCVTIVSFIEEYGIENFENNETKDIYNAYGTFCMENGLKEAYSNISFSMYIKKQYPLDIVDKKIMGKKCRIFVQRKDG